MSPLPKGKSGFQKLKERKERVTAQQKQLQAQQPCLPIPIPLNQPYSQLKKEVGSIVLNDMSVGIIAGYGEIYPVTLNGKVVCILYAMVGIPLMLLVITDVGDLMAVLLSRAYIHLHTLFCRLRQYGRWFRSHHTEKSGDGGQGDRQDGTYTFSHKVIVQEPIDIRQVLHSQQSVKCKSNQLLNNTKIFDCIIAQENFNRQGPLVRSLSCHELDSMPPLPKDFAIWDFTGIGESMDKLNVPLLLILVVVFTYILFGGLILPLWETEFNTFDAYYFCFITLTTIGFGDIVPNHPKFFMLTFIFIITGMAIMSMAFKLGQSCIVSCYRQCMRCISGGEGEEV
uniref:potassium channel subfamily K member 18-like n=1 Tax=Oncorhynchus gorbuscha TaxID=8017 RepID=UPI001EAF0FE8|nr:potassium channel subfamily K member 18-like [Oncorhynchus gorbuscha]